MDYFDVYSFYRNQGVAIMSTIEQQVIFALKLLNTISSANFKKSLQRKWISNVANCDANVAVIQTRQTNKLVSKLFSKYVEPSDFSAAIEYTLAVATANNIKLKKSSYKGLIQRITLDDYAMFKDYIYSTCNAQNLFHINQMHQSGRFYASEFLWEIVSYLTVQDSITNQSGNQKFEQLKQNLLCQKSPAFFDSNYNSDFFICDRYNLSYAEDIKYIAIRKDYLSTKMINKTEKVDLNDPMFDYLKVA